MFILVKKETNVIVGSAVKPLSQMDADIKNIEVYEIDDKEFDVNIIGCILESFEEVA
jgi:hypothetical protein